jgi:hypothetical protein
LSSAKERLLNEPVAASNLVGAAASIGVGVGVPVSEDLKVGVIGAIMAVATLYGRSQVSPVRSLPEVPAVEPSEGVVQ